MIAHAATPLCQLLQGHLVEIRGLIQYDPCACESGRPHWAGDGDSGCGPSAVSPVGQQGSSSKSWNPRCVPSSTRLRHAGGDKCSRARSAPLRRSCSRTPHHTPSRGHAGGGEPGYGTSGAPAACAQRFASRPRAESEPGSKPRALSHVERGTSAAARLETPHLPPVPACLDDHSAEVPRRHWRPRLAREGCGRVAAPMRRRRGSVWSKWPVPTLD